MTDCTAGPFPLGPGRFSEDMPVMEFNSLRGAPMRG